MSSFNSAAVAIAALLSVLLTFPAAAQEVERFDGRLTVLWGDPLPEGSLEAGAEAQASQLRHVLTTDKGRSFDLAISAQLRQQTGEFVAWNGRRVAAFLRSPDGEHRSGQRAVAALRLLPETSEAPSLGTTVSGSQPWVSILCKFSDKDGEPKDLAFFQGMYANTPGGLDHYWREVSYGAIDVVGSTAVDWVDLPQPHTFYAPMPGQGSDADLGALFQDCTTAADPFVDFGNSGSPFAGINMMFNDVLDCCAWGGSRFATLDGVNKQWRVTWEPPWAYAQEGVIAHEMGHGFGLPHATNWDDDDFPYDNPWDVMSVATNYGVNHPTYGRLGKHINGYHKDRLGWIAPAERFDVTGAGTFAITLDGMAVPSTPNHRIAVIPLSQDRWYVVEARTKQGEYEANLPESAVIIHEVVNGRSEPSWSVDEDVPPADYADNPGSRWTPGETFTDPDAGISVTVVMETTNGFLVDISTGLAGSLFADGFESGDTSAWSVTVP